MNEIPARQNEDSLLRSMRAARQCYSDGKRLLGLQMVLTIGVPVVGVALGFITADLTIKAMVAAISLGIAILDASVLDRAIKNAVRRGAKAQEKFDTDLLGIPWDAFTVGEPLAPEELHDMAERYSRKNSDEAIIDWYPTIVGSVPIHYARIVCQRTNLWYDSTLRKHYGRAILSLAVGLTALIFVAGLVAQASFQDLVISAFAPAAPLLGWSVREFFRQKDTVAGQDQVRKHADALWNRIKSIGCNQAECDVQARQFQDAIFNRRSTGPLVFDWVYRLRRPSLESQMNAGAEALIDQLRLAGRI